ncbi:MAG: hypothetical protein HY010_15410 [Acidobacteria bacterium]|nr:hypothetical protein [Acidobacteriota bacterium]
MQLLTDGSEKKPLLGFCLTVISEHGENWPPAEEVLARQFVNWLGLSSFLTKDAMKELCRSKGVNLSFVSLPKDVRGVNCTFQDKREIVISETAMAPFSDLHTLLHEFREMIEHEFGELGQPTIGPKDLEEHAEHFAMSCRMKAAERELPAFIKMARSVERKWPRYIAYSLIAVFGVAYFFDCIFLPQMENIAAEIDRQRYVRT